MKTFDTMLDFGAMLSARLTIYLERNAHKTWASNTPRWRALVKDVNFPVAKVKERGQIGRLPSPKLSVKMYHAFEPKFH